MTTTTPRRANPVRYGAVPLPRFARTVCAQPAACAHQAGGAGGVRRLLFVRPLSPLERGAGAVGLFMGVGRGGAREHEAARPHDLLSRLPAASGGGGAGGGDAHGDVRGALLARGGERAGAE